MEQETLIVKGARVHNLKNIDVEMPRDKLIVITGLSGSGKSSLAFDTIYAEGQRRYVESLSAYARQFLGLMERPDVDYIEGLSPAISIEQKTVSHNPRSTVGTVTEIYDYLRLLFARVGVQHCYNCDRPVTRQSVDQIIDTVMAYDKETKIQILSPVIKGRKGHYRELFEKIVKDGFLRVRIDGEVKEIKKGLQANRYQLHDIEIVVDRLVVRPDMRSRIAESIEMALQMLRLSASSAQRSLPLSISCSSFKRARSRWLIVKVCASFIAETLHLFGKDPKMLKPDILKVLVHEPDIWLKLLDFHPLLVYIHKSMSTPNHDDQQSIMNPGPSYC